MELLPPEIVELIGQFLDVTSAVRFSRTCWRNYETTRTYVLKMTRRKLLFDDICAIKYEICKRDKSTRREFYGKYCGVRTYPDGRVVGTVRNTADDQIQMTAFFAERIKLRAIGYDIEGDYLNTERRDVEIFRCTTWGPLTLTRDNITKVHVSRVSNLVAPSVIKMYEDALMHDA